MDGIVIISDNSSKNTRIKIPDYCNSATDFEELQNYSRQKMGNFYTSSDPLDRIADALERIAAALENAR